MDVISQIVRQIRPGQNMTSALRQYVDGEFATCSSQLGILRAILEAGVEADEQVCSVVYSAWVILCERALWRSGFQDIDAFKDTIRFATDVQPTIDRHVALTRYKRKQEDAIEKVWGVRITEAFPAEWCPSTWGKCTLEHISLLSRLTTCDNGIEALREGIKSRPERSRNTSILTTSDVARALELVRAKTGSKALRAPSITSHEVEGQDLDSGLGTPDSIPAVEPMEGVEGAEWASMPASDASEHGDKEVEAQDDDRSGIQSPLQRTQNGGKERMARSSKPSSASAPTSRPSRIRRGICTCPAAFRSAATDKTQRLALLRSGNKGGFRNLCHPCLRTFAGSWGMYNSKVSHETMHERLQALYLHRSDVVAFRQKHKTWFRVDPNDCELPTVWKYQPRPLRRFTFDQKRVFERFAGPGSWDKFRSNGTIIVDGLFKYLWANEEGIGSFINQEFRMYDHHLNIIPGRPDMGWARNMYHSVIQQLMSQDPVWYALIAASRLDGEWRLVVFPYNAKCTKVNQSAAFLHLDVNIWDYLNGEPYDFTQTLASLDDEADDGCTVQVPGMVGATFDEWCKRAVKRQPPSSSSTTDCKKLYNKDDRAKYGQPIPYPCLRGAVRLSLPTVVHGSTSSKRERRAVSPWFFSVGEDHHTVERPCSLTWPELAQCHRDRVGPFKESLGDNPRPGVGNVHFPGAVLLRGCSALGDALLGHRKWDYEVMEEIGILLGDDEHHAMKYVERNRARLLQRAKEVYPLVEKAERAAYGDNSYFAKGDGKRNGC